MTNKYYNKKCTVNGIVFDSRKEARRWQELLLLEKAGIITGLVRQKEFELIPAQYVEYPRFGKDGKRLKNGKKLLERSCNYIADFAYVENCESVVEDTKGIKTKDYIIKWKLMLSVYGIRIREV